MAVEEALPVPDELVRALVDEQFPHLAQEELGRRYTVEDHITVRIGDNCGAIFPRFADLDELFARVAGLVAPQASRWTFPASYPVATGRPAQGYPWHWVLVEWISASTAGFVPLHPAAVGPLGEAVREIHTKAPRKSPLNPSTGVGLDAWRNRFSALLDHAIAVGAPENKSLDADATRRLFEAGAAAPVDTPSTWTHGRLEPRAILSDRGIFAGVLLWHRYGAGDPAGDLGMVSNLLPLDIRDDFLAAYGKVSRDTLSRAVAYQVLDALDHIRLGDPFVLRMAWERLIELDLVYET